MTSHVKTLIMLGTQQESSPLYFLKGHDTIWGVIFTDLDSISKQHVEHEAIAYQVRHTAETMLSSCAVLTKLHPLCYMTYNDQVTAKDLWFPAPQGLRINMMPIKYCSRGIYATVPPDCAQYISMIKRCSLDTVQYRGGNDHVMYLTVHEELVPVGQPHRRPGVHVERLGYMANGGRMLLREDMTDQQYKAEYGHCGDWGHGEWSDDTPIDGIYCASNVADSCKVWPVLIAEPAQVTDQHGGLAHFREYLGASVMLPANALCWMTDRTPHETLPLQALAHDRTAEYVYRQFFRLVVGKLAVWYSQHNTPNPCGLLPDVPIVDVDKFAV
jgi:hypothetical protein